MFCTVLSFVRVLKWTISWACRKHRTVVIICVGKLFVKRSFVGVLRAERRILLKRNIQSYAVRVKIGFFGSGYGSLTGYGEGNTKAKSRILIKNLSRTSRLSILFVLPMAGN